MSEDERTQDLPKSDPQDEAGTVEMQPAPASRWAAVSVPARRHPVGMAVGSAIVGLVVGLVGGLAIEAAPMMSLTVGMVPSPAAVDRLVPGGPPPPGAPWESGPRMFDGPGGPPPPPGPGHHRPPGPGAPPLPGAQPPPPLGGPLPPPGDQLPAPSGGPMPARPGSVGPPGAETPGSSGPQPSPLPAERGGTTPG
ncbi:MAG: hypothetical protein WBB07_01055 [Mycobacterium sp.]